MTLYKNQYFHIYIYIYINFNSSSNFVIKHFRRIDFPTVLYIYNCRQYCFDLSGLVSAVKLCWERTRLTNWNLVANLLLVVFKPQ